MPIGAASEARSKTVSAGALIAAREQPGAERGADQSAMEGHAAAPDLEDFERAREVIARVVEQHVAEPAADDDAERAIDEQIVDAVGRGALHAAPQRVGGDDAADQPPAGDQPDDIGERVPANRQRTQLKQNGVDDGKRQHETWALES